AVGVRGWDWGLGIGDWGCPLSPCLLISLSPCLQGGRWSLVGGRWSVVYVRQARVAASSAATSASSSAQPSAPAFSLACLAFLAPGMGRAPRWISQFSATCPAVLSPWAAPIR